METFHLQLTSYVMQSLLGLMLTERGMFPQFYFESFSRIKTCHCKKTQFLGLDKTHYVEDHIVVPFPRF